jgi:hypothetical protein
MQEIVSHTKHISFLSHLSVTHNFSPHNLVFFTLFVTKKKTLRIGETKLQCAVRGSSEVENLHICTIPIPGEDIILTLLQVYIGRGTLIAATSTKSAAPV